MADMWICADCRSANEAKAKRCYRCGVPRAQGELTEATAAAAAASAQATRTVLATATRLGARYRPTWPLAIVASILIFATTGLIVVQARSDIARVTSDGRLIEDPGTAQAGLSMDAVVVIAFLAGVLVWSIWIALVVANVPALTARWPTRSPTGAFFAQWIPIINLKRPFTVVRDVVIILSGGAAGPALVVILWWIAFLARYVVPFVYVFLRVIGNDDPTPGDTVRTGSQISIYVSIIAAGLAACVLLTVEYYQNLALRRRSVVVLGE